jgi:hypothetical protein
VGFVFSRHDPYAGFDLDNCRNPDSGEIAGWAQDIIAKLNSYSEISPSGTGVKVFLKGTLPPNARHNAPCATGSLEAYDCDRYFTVTGQHIPGTPATIENRQSELMATYAEVFGTTATPTAATVAPSPTHVPAAKPGTRKFTRGERIPFLRSLAGSLIKQGWGEADITAALLQENRERCDPPHADGKIRSLIQDLVRRYGHPAETKRVAVPAESVSLRAAKMEISRWLALEPGEDQAVDVSTAAVVANDLEGDPLFTILVAPSSSAKTEVLRGLQGDVSTHFLGSLTPRTLVSGLDPQKTSLLLQLDSSVHTLVIKDFGAILAMSPDERGELLQQFRDIYDGMVDRNWGTGKCVHWEGRLGLLAGATGAIEREFSALNVLGERFLFFRLPKGNRQKQAERALAVAGREREMREAISSSVRGVVRGARERIKKRIPDCPLVTQSALSVVARAITQSRTPVVRDRFDKTVQLAPALEGPARTAKALKKLGIALAAVYGNESVGNREVALLATIGLSNIPSLRRLVIEKLRDSDIPLSHKAIGLQLGVPTLTVSRVCEDLSLLEVVQRESSTQSDAAQFRVSLNPHFQALWDQIIVFSRAYVPHTESADRVCADGVGEPKLNPQNGIGVPEPHADQDQRTGLTSEPRILFADDREEI